MNDYVEKKYDTIIPNFSNVTQELIYDEENDNRIIKQYKDTKYKYLEYKNDNNKKLFKCLTCDYIFNRVDNLQNNFNRQVKCDENIKTQEINKIKEQNDNPIIKVIEVDNYEHNDKYTYYEKYNEYNREIEYYCNNCEFKTNNLNILKNHYIKRKIKCYDEVHKDKFIYINNENKECKYFKLDINKYKCGACEYMSTRTNVIRHYDKKNKCYNTNEIPKEYNGLKYYIKLIDKKKVYFCHYCEYKSPLQHSVTRHLTKSINPCYIKSSI